MTMAERITVCDVVIVRLPGYVISAEVIFGMPDQRLSIRHDSGASARPVCGRRVARGSSRLDVARRSPRP
jgi:hypothetical protein